MTDRAPGEPSSPAHGRDARVTGSPKDRLLELLAHPNIASKHWAIRQYDHEVQGGSVVKPLVGPLQIGPSDAAVIRPKLGSNRGIAIGCGLAPHVRDPYAMALAAIDEAISNVVCVGADPSQIAILDNFCWPSVDTEQSMGDLVRTCEACRDAALAYGIPFISGKDSLHNQFTTSETGEVIRIPNTLLVSAIAVLADVRRCVTMDLKKPGNEIAVVQTASGDNLLDLLPKVHRAIAEAIRRGLVASCHDVSDGGTLVAAAEMCIASGLGMNLGFDRPGHVFSERVGAYVIEHAAGARDELDQLVSSYGARFDPGGVVVAEPRLRVEVRDADATEWPVGQLTAAWRGTLDW